MDDFRCAAAVVALATLLLQLLGAARWLQTPLPLCGGGCIAEPSQTTSVISDNATQLLQSVALGSAPFKVAVYLPTTLCPSAETSRVCRACHAALTCFEMTPVDERSYKRRTLELLARLFGGGHCLEVDGVFYSEDRDALVAETTFVCAAFGSLQQKQAALGTVVEYTQQLGRELGQEAMALEVDGALYFLPAAPAVPPVVSHDQSVVRVFA